ncbi:hypothetical protein PISMIDRAFT_689624, partial [Pisolithus microcarpus 441]
MGHRTDTGTIHWSKQQQPSHILTKATQEVPALRGRTLWYYSLSCVCGDRINSLNQEPEYLLSVDLMPSYRPRRLGMLGPHRLRYRP